DKNPKIFASEETCTSRPYATNSFGRVNVSVRNGVGYGSTKRSDMRAMWRNHLKRIDVFNAFNLRRNTLIDDG
ncbi:hypothetical protein, partial [Burkholderia sp.]|uniref:hypothetical protein n=1 Tax=Burkholderia sp. TaxID=36773 RepID=UPI00258957A7